NWFATASCNIKVLNKIRRDLPHFYRTYESRIRRKLAVFHQAVGSLHFKGDDFRLARLHFLKSLLNKPSRRSLKYLFLSVLSRRPSAFSLASNHFSELP